MRRNTLDSIIARCVVNDDGCWLWPQAQSQGGYGRCSVAGVAYYVHRYVYEQLRGPIPDRLQLDHLCRQPACANPDHLEPVTCRENLLRGNTFQAANAAKTRCPQGHPYDIFQRGERACRVCRRQSWREYTQRKRAG